jgi:hypothetical protein
MPRRARVNSRDRRYLEKPVGVGEKLSPGEVSSSKAATQIKRITTQHAVPGEPQVATGESNVRMYFPQGLDALLKYNGPGH